MANVLLINETYIKKYTMINGAVDANLLYPAIYLAQDKYLHPYLGTNLFEKIKDDVANNTLAGDYETLVQDYVRPVVLWYTMQEVTPYLAYKLDNGSLVQRTSDDAQPVTDTVMKDLIDRCRANAEMYSRLLCDYLCANSSLFPEYTNNVWPQRAPITYNRSSNTYIISSGNSATGLDYGERRLSQIP